VFRKLHLATTRKRSEFRICSAYTKPLKGFITIAISREANFHLSISKRLSKANSPDPKDCDKAQSEEIQTTATTSYS
jgi:hypothetical protein